MVVLGVVLCLIVALVGLGWAYRLESKRASAKAKSVSTSASLDAFDVNYAAQEDHNSYVNGIIERSLLDGRR